MNANHEHVDLILAQLDQLIAKHSILQHPFYQALATGCLSVEDLAVYAWGYYPHVGAFSDYLRDAIAHVEEPHARQLLEENLQDELCVPAPHTELWCYFAQGLGISRQELEDALPLPEVARSISTFQQLCQQSTVSALSALYAYESQQPEVSKLAYFGLQEYYQIYDPQTLWYFRCHMEADVRHREDAREALRLCLIAGASSHALFEATQSALDAHWDLLSGVCRQAGLCC